MRDPRNELEFDLEFQSSIEKKKKEVSMDFRLMSCRTC